MIQDFRSSIIASKYQIFSMHYTTRSRSSGQYIKLKTQNQILKKGANESKKLVSSLSKSLQSYIDNTKSYEKLVLPKKAIQNQKRSQLQLNPQHGNIEIGQTKRKKNENGKKTIKYLKQKLKELQKTVLEQKLEYMKEILEKTKQKQCQKEENRIVRIQQCMNNQIIRMNNQIIRMNNQIIRMNNQIIPRQQQQQRILNKHNELFHQNFRNMELIEKKLFHYIQESNSTERNITKVRFHYQDNQNRYSYIPLNRSQENNQRIYNQEASRRQSARELSFRGSRVQADIAADRAARAKSAQVQRIASQRETIESIRNKAIAQVDNFLDNY